MIRLKLKTRTYKRKTEKTLLEAGWQGYKTYKWIKNVFFNWNVFNITEEKGPGNLKYHFSEMKYLIMSKWHLLLMMKLCLWTGLSAQGLAIPFKNLVKA